MSDVDRKESRHAKGVLTWNSFYVCLLKMFFSCLYFLGLHVFVKKKKYVPLSHWYLKSRVAKLTQLIHVKIITERLASPACFSLKTASTMDVNSYLKTKLKQSLWTIICSLCKNISTQQSLFRTKRNSSLVLHLHFKSTRSLKSGILGWLFHVAVKASRYPDSPLSYGLARAGSVKLRSRMHLRSSRTGKVSHWRVFPCDCGIQMDEQRTGYTECTLNSSRC